MRVCEQGIANAWELIDTDEAVRSICYLLRYQRQADGAFPQQVSPTGASMFGQEGRNLTLDSAPFAARTVVMIAERTSNELRRRGGGGRATSLPQLINFRKIILFLNNCLKK